MRLKLLTKDERKANREKAKTDARFDKLIARLDIGKEAERQVAAAELREQWPDAVQRLLTKYETTTNLWKKRGKWLLFSLCWMFAGFAIDVYASHRGVHFSPFVKIMALP